MYFIYTDKFLVYRELVKKSPALVRFFYDNVVVVVFLKIPLNRPLQPMSRIPPEGNPGHDPYNGSIVRRALVDPAFGEP